MGGVYAIGCMVFSGWNYNARRACVSASRLDGARGLARREHSPGTSAICGCFAIRWGGLSHYGFRSRTFPTRSQYPTPRAGGSGIYGSRADVSDWAPDRSLQRGSALGTSAVIAALLWQVKIPALRSGSPAACGAGGFWADTRLRRNIHLRMTLFLIVAFRGYPCVLVVIFPGVRSSR